MKLTNVKIKHSDIKTIVPIWVQYMHWRTDKDYYYVKERVELKDGTIVPRLKLVENFKRSWWKDNRYVPNGKNINLYKDMKEFEEERYLSEYKTTQKDLWKDVAEKMGKGRSFSNARRWEANPYLYGTKLLPESLLMSAYRKKYGTVDSVIKLGVLDIEACTRTGEVFINAVSTYDELYMVFNQRLIKGDKEKFLVDMRAGIMEEFKDSKITKNMKVILSYGDEREVITKPILRLHTYDIDVVGIWNMNYDIPVIEKRLRFLGLDHADYWCDPVVPYNDRHANFKQGKNYKITEGGVRMNKAPEEIWSVFDIIAKFQVMDMMTTYKAARNGAGKENGGYSLQNIANKYLGVGKVHMNDPIADKLSGAKLHDYMAHNQFLKYGIYASGDVIRLLELDLKTNDMRIAMPQGSGDSPWHVFNSEPQTVHYKYHLYLRTVRKVIGNQRPKSVLDKEDKLLGRKGWVRTLSSAMRRNPGAGLLNYDGCDSRFELNVTDLDQEAGYPNNGIATGMSRHTTENEWKEVSNIDKEVSKNCNRSLVYGIVNHLEYAEEMFDLMPINEVIEKVRSKELV